MNRQTTFSFTFLLAALALASLGLANKAEAHPKACYPSGYSCKNNHECCSGACVLRFFDAQCL